MHEGRPFFFTLLILLSGTLAFSEQGHRKEPNLWKGLEEKVYVDPGPMNSDPATPYSPIVVVPNSSPRPSSSPRPVSDGKPDENALPSYTYNENAVKKFDGSNGDYQFNPIGKDGKPVELLVRCENDKVVKSSDPKLVGKSCSALNQSFANPGAPPTEDYSYNANRNC